MNWRLVVFSSIVTAVLGGLTGTTFAYLGQPDVGRFRYESGIYQSLYRFYPAIGAGLGFVIGGGFSIVSQTTRRRSASLRSQQDRLTPPGQR